jgi:proteasome lid subunit RPN8/RPN11
LVEVLAVSALEIASTLLAETVDALCASKRRERVVLWLGRRHGHGVRVHEVYVPIQETEADYFRIPHDGMEALFRHMRPRRLMVAAQVHTHPEAAFHSAVDDRWAIVRHHGALSLVVPCFCQATTAATFAQDAKVYQLDEQDEFVEVAPSAYEVTP